MYTETCGIHGYYDVDGEMWFARSKFDIYGTCDAYGTNMMYTENRDIYGNM